MTDEEKKDEVVVPLKLEIAERDGRLAKKDQQLVEKDVRIAELEDCLAKV